jgi:hypothetical protein
LKQLEAVFTEGKDKDLTGSDSTVSLTTKEAAAMSKPTGEADSDAPNCSSPFKTLRTWVSQPVSKSKDAGNMEPNAAKKDQAKDD